MNGEQLAERFHETYERLAPRYGYETRKDSAVPWEEVPEQNKALMTAVADEILTAITADLVVRQEFDARVIAWERIATHPFFASCFEESSPLLDAMLRRLNQQSADAPLIREAVLIRLRVTKQTLDTHNLQAAPEVLADIQANLDRFADLGDRLGIARIEWEDKRRY